jgi:hypothetical protein
MPDQQVQRLSDSDLEAAIADRAARLHDMPFGAPERADIEGELSAFMLIQTTREHLSA